MPDPTQPGPENPISTRCKLDSGSMYGNVPLCDSPADIVVVYRPLCGDKVFESPVCRRHLGAKRGQVYPAEILDEREVIR